MIDLHRDVLPRLERRQRPAVLRLEVERRDDVALAHLAIDDERPVAVPAAGSGGLRCVDLGLAAREDLGEEPVRLGPGGDDLVGRGVAEHVLDRDEQVLADDRVVLGLNPERAVLLSDELDRGTKRGGIVDMGGISANGAGQGPLLTT